jgi:hypothetical protein
VVVSKQVVEGTAPPLYVYSKNAERTGDASARVTQLERLGPSGIGMAISASAPSSSSYRLSDFAWAFPIKGILRLPTRPRSGPGSTVQSGVHRCPVQAHERGSVPVTLRWLASSYQ